MSADAQDIWARDYSPASHAPPTLSADVYVRQSTTPRSFKKIIFDIGVEIHACGCERMIFAAISTFGFEAIS